MTQINWFFTAIIGKLKNQGGQKALDDDTKAHIIQYLNVCSDWAYPTDSYDLRIIVKLYLYHMGITNKRFKVFAMIVIATCHAKKKLCIEKFETSPTRAYSHRPVPLHAMHGVSIIADTQIRKCKYITSPVYIVRNSGILWYLLNLSYTWFQICGSSLNCFVSDLRQDYFGHLLPTHL